MKNLSINKIFFVLVAIMAISCTDDVLNKNPEVSVSPEVFYSSASNLEPGLYGVYDALQADKMYGETYLLDGLSDNARLDRYDTDLINFSMGEANADVRGSIAGYYGAAYQLIQRANLLLDNIDVPGAISDFDRNTIEAEAKALRAIAYMRLVYYFGDVQLITTFTDRADLLEMERTNRDVVVQFILDELEEAGEVLGTSNSVGRLTKQAVLGMRGKILVFEARMGNGSWTDALSQLSDVMTIAEGAGADLFGNYEGLFHQDNENNEEILFSTQFDNLDRGRDFYFGMNPSSTVLQISVHTNLVDDYYTTDGLPITDASSVYDPLDPYSNRDPRLGASILLPGDQYPDTDGNFLTFNGTDSNADILTDFAVKKLATLDGIAMNEGQLDAIVLRYADVLLMFAEAENEVNGASTTAYTAINRVRARVGMPNVTPALSKNAFRDEVIHERRVELTFEGHRWMDLITLGIASSTINAISELDRAFVSNKQELFPIPQSEIDLNSKISQNPGY